MRRTWQVCLAHEGPRHRTILVIGDDGYVGAMLWESVSRGGEVSGFRFPQSQEPQPCDATSLDDALLGIRNAFRLDEVAAMPQSGLDAVVRMN